MDPLQPHISPEPSGAKFHRPLRRYYCWFFVPDDRRRFLSAGRSPAGIWWRKAVSLQITRDPAPCLDCALRCLGRLFVSITNEISARVALRFQYPGARWLGRLFSREKALADLDGRGRLYYSSHG